MSPDCPDAEALVRAILVAVRANAGTPCAVVLHTFALRWPAAGVADGIDAVALIDADEITELADFFGDKLSVRGVSEWVERNWWILYDRRSLIVAGDDPRRIALTIAELSAFA